MRICVIGAGYVGLATGVMFGKLGHEVVCVDIDGRRLRDISAGRLPFYEPPLEKELRKLVKNGMLSASGDIKKSVARSKFVFLCVQTPSLSSGKIDIRALKTACRDVARAMAGADGYRVIVVKSTVVPSTTDTVLKPILEDGSGKSIGREIGLCVNPEFLQEGSALKDSMEPSRIVVGAHDKRSSDALARLYSPIKSSTFRTDLRTAEMIKYAANSFLAAKISYANEMANLCLRLGIDSEQVLAAVGEDPRIGKLFLKPGLGFGGSCLPKDVRALKQKARELDYPAHLLTAIQRINDEQPDEAISILKSVFKDLKGLRIAVLGLSFKGGVDDVRDTRAVPLITSLLAKNVEVVAYDPIAMSRFIELMPTIRYASTVEDALTQADACVIQADWPEFREIGRAQFSKMRNPVVIDGRRLLDPGEVEASGAKYFGVGYGRARRE
ncbi:MAG: UDP-glucose/GDP-mannose dehydrogenase family protein [Methanobacteriota archaeon]|nr:MAG: UDP-glucose/GDP-mannose dehydrogenase family protein [Euryarchaeota archaeon]